MAGATFDSTMAAPGDDERGTLLITAPFDDEEMLRAAPR